MAEFLEKSVHDEFEKRMTAEDNRQNHRIDVLEDQVKQFNALALSVERLAQSVETLAKDLTGQGTRLTALEGKDGEKWRKTVDAAIVAVVGGIVGVVIGLLI